jgi:murein L,D-transpeptidase YafK
MFTHTIFIRPDSEFIRESVCACAKLFVDEESTWHKKTDMKFIILVSNLKEISSSVFSWKKQYIKNYDAILLSKYDSAEKKILN